MDGPQGLCSDNEQPSGTLGVSKDDLWGRDPDPPVGWSHHEFESLMLHLRNTLTRQIEPVVPLESGRIRMYSCGPTVYRYAHVGNLRSFMLADLIRRVALYHGLEVLHVQNITDVGHLRDEHLHHGDDPMLIQAGLEGKTPEDIAAAYEAAFHADAALVNILPAHVFPRATEHIPEMIQLAESLEDAGHAYATPEGNVYYSVATFPRYGALSGNSLDDLRAGHRGDVEPDKRDHADFALWKRASEGRLLKWPTPRWGDGFPGWHLECSAMAMRYLGAQFDIHTGGIDNVFPHHEDEIAQSEPIGGDIPARTWVHGEFLLAHGHKMAKSAGNFQRVTELMETGVDPLAFRYLALTAKYGRKLEYSDRSVRAAARALESLRSGLRALGAPPAAGSWAPEPPLVAGAAGDRPDGIADGSAGHGDGQAYVSRNRADDPAAPLSPVGRGLHDRFVAAIDDDLDMPGAVALLREILRARIPADERRWLILDADLVLGLDLHRTWETTTSWTSRQAGGSVEPSPEVLSLLADRSAARASANYDLADSIRDELSRRGWEVVDEPSGSRVRQRVETR
jgi:cysteinyl-tRNA synthetase